MAAPESGSTGSCWAGRPTRTPTSWRNVDARIFGELRPPRSREEVALAFAAYAGGSAWRRGVPLKSMTRHIMGLFNGLPGARAWRRHLAEEAHKPGAGPQVIEGALEGPRGRRARGGPAA